MTATPDAQKSALSRGRGSLSLSLSSTPPLQQLRPHNLDLLGVLAQSVGKKWRRKTGQAKLAYIVHSLCETRARHRAEPEKFVPLSYSLLVGVVGSRYTAEAIRVLLVSRVIETDNHFIPGAKSRGYRFAPKYRTQVEAFPPFTKTAEKSALQRRQRITEAIGDSPEHAFIFGCLPSLSFSSDVETVLGAPGLTEEARSHLRLSVDSLRRGVFEFSTDPKTGRVFHNVTNMAKPLRACLLVDGRPSVEIDIANAQPLLLLSLYPCDAPADERARYADLVSRGRFYPFLNDCAGRPYNADDPESREALKRAVQQQILSGKLHYNGKLRQAFARVFPTLARYVEQAKQDDYAALSLLLQRTESELVVRRVVGRLLREHPGTKAITIHDGILCAQDDAPAVESVLSEETRNFLGVRPTLRRKNVSSEPHPPTKPNEQES